MHKCPWCKGEMIPRKSTYGSFYGCSNYPNCTATMDLPNYEEDTPDVNNGEDYGTCIRCGKSDYLSDMKLCNYCQHVWDSD